MRRNVFLSLLLLVLVFSFVGCGKKAVSHTLTVEVQGAGTVEPESGTYDKGTIATLKATPDAGSVFSGWEGRNGSEVTQNGDDWAILMNGDKEITAVFREILSYDLDVKVIGQGDVYMELASENEVPHLPENTLVRLIAQAAPNWAFARWEGDVEGTENVIVVEMDSDKDITAVFESPLESIELKVTGDGSIKVVWLQEESVTDYKVRFTAIPAANYLFKKWEGGASGTEEIVDVTFARGEELTVTAAFYSPLENVNITIDGEGQVSKKLMVGTDIVAELTAKPASGYRFSHWSGALDSTEIVEEVVIESEQVKNITAHFISPLEGIEVEIEGAGRVDIELLPLESSLEKARFTAVAAPDWQFKEWLGDATGSDAVVEIELDENFALKAVFEEKTQKGDALVYGYVTNYRGGPRLAGVKVESPNGFTFTSADGYFEIDMPAGENTQLTFTKDGFCTSFIQDLILESKENFYVEVPVRDTFSPKYPLDPPTITVSGVKSGDTISGNLKMGVKIDSGDLDTFVFYVYFGSFHRVPVEFQEIDLDSGFGIINTTRFPNGKNFIRVMAYDYNGNLTMKFIPVTVNNEGDSERQKPGKLEKLDITSTTFGETYRFYSDQTLANNKTFGLQKDPSTLILADGSSIDLTDVPNEATLIIEVEWNAIEDADGYRVERNIGGEGFETVCYLGANQGAPRYKFQDTSPLLLPDVEIEFRVIPYNSAGDGQGVTRTVTPLQPFNVYLLSPAHLANEVELQPTFTWEIDVEFHEDVEKEYAYLILNCAKPFAWQGITNKEMYFLPGDDKLEPAATYTWGILEAVAYLDIEDDTGVTSLLSIAGAGEGTSNGDFIFTTVTELE